MSTMYLAIEGYVGVFYVDKVTIAVEAYVGFLTQQ